LMGKEPVIDCPFDLGCPENRRYPACDPQKHGVSKLCMKNASLKEVPLTEATLKFDRRFRSNGESKVR